MSKTVKFDRKVKTETGYEYSFTVGVHNFRGTFNIAEDFSYSYVKLWQYGSGEFVLTTEEYQELKETIKQLDEEIEKRR